MSHGRWSIRVRAAYWYQAGWFYAWKWTQHAGLWWLHRRTIGPVNHARQTYLDFWRAER